MPIIRRFSRQGSQLLFNGAPVNLAGIYAGTGETSTTDRLVPPFGDDMQRLVMNENNFTRHIVTPYWVYSPVSALDPTNCCFAREGGKWNLRSYNPTYFTRLKSMIDTAADYGIAVQVVLFDRTGLDTSKPGDPHRRWDDCPWNAANNVNGVVRSDVGANIPYSGLPEFYRPDPTLRSIQEAYIRHVVAQTRSWNVFYEVMNEPMYGQVDERVRWADWAVGVINSATGGLNLIFYNDHNPVGAPHGSDVTRWRQLGGNYSKFHGVILHGVPTDFKPSNPAYATWAGEKIFQVSTDTAPPDQRGTTFYNDVWCGHAFAHKMMFQAHTNALEAAAGIKKHHPSPIEPVYVDPINGGAVERV